MIETVLVFLLALIPTARTIMYGVWTIKEKNISGGIFVIILSLFTLFLAARYMLKA